MLDKKIILQKMIDEAWLAQNEAHEAEADSGYAVEAGFERKEAEGFAMGLERAYFTIFDEVYETLVEISLPDDED